MFLVVLYLGQTGCGDSGSGAGDTAAEVSANAGDDQEILVGEATSLDGLSSSRVKTAAWSFVSTPDGSSASITNSDSLTASFTPDVEGEYVIQLSINGGGATDSLTLTAKNVIAEITVPGVTLDAAQINSIKSVVSSRERLGLDEYTIDLEDTGGQLSAEGSQVASGRSIVSYAWEQVSGPSSTTTGDTASSAFSFAAPSLADFLNSTDRYKWQVFPISRDDTEIIFKLTVASDAGDSDSATLTIALTDDGEEIHTSTGLPNVGVNTTVYLSGPGLDATGASATVAANENGDPVTDWNWTLSIPSGSSAVFTDSGTTTSTSQFPKFVPDVAGVYTVTHASTTGNQTHTNPTTKASGSLAIYAGEYVGVGTIGGTSATNPQCGTCHDGVVQDDKLTGWTQTTHASIFEQSVSLYDSLSPAPYLWPYHTVGYNDDADNDGFDDLVSNEGFTFPDTGMTFSEFTENYPDIAALANVQCESCHGPGSGHSGDPTHIGVSTSQFGVCGSCHIQENQFKNSLHNSSGVSHGSGNYQNSWVTNAGCVRCHNSGGFLSYLESGEEELASVAADFETGDFVGITCAACHDPHSAENEKQLRLAGEVDMVVDDSTVDAGKAAVCYTCHDGFYAHGEDDCDPDNNRATSNNVICETIDQTATQYLRQVHYNPQGPVLEGKGALTDLDGDGDADFTLDENSFHSDENFTLADATGDNTLSSENNKCVTCHMATAPTKEEDGYGHLGGHAFKLRSEHGIGHLLGEETEDDTTEEAGAIELTSACQSCHLTLTEFNRTARADYDGDGSVEGVQDEISGLLVALTTKIKSRDTTRINQTSGTVVSSGVITVNTLSYTGANTTAQTDSFNALSATLRRGVWNHNLIVRDGSLGIHNAAYTIQVLQGTYTAVGGNSFITDYPNATVR